MATHSAAQEVDSSGNAIRIGNGGLAFAVGLDGTSGNSGLTLDTSVMKVPDSGEPDLTAEQIQDKLAAAEARREVALEEIRHRAAEESEKVEKASEVRQQYQEGARESLDAKLSQAQANQEEHRAALLERLRLEELQHEQVLSKRAEAFHTKVRDMDARYLEQEGNRHEVLVEIVDKLKEHNDRVKSIHDQLTDSRRKDGVDAGISHSDGALKQQQNYFEASQFRDIYIGHAESRLAGKDIQPPIAKYL